MDELKKFIDNLEFLFLKTVANDLQNEAITIPNAKAYAIEFRKIEPFTSIEDAQQKVVEFVKRFPRFKTLQEYADAFYHEQKIEKIIEKMRHYLKNKNIDAALQAAKEK